MNQSAMRKGFENDLISRLPPVRGIYIHNAALGEKTWFRTGGTAEVLFDPADTDDLIAFLKGKPADVPHMALGLGSNILVRDGGISGTVIRFGKSISKIEVTNSQIHAGAGAFDHNVAMACFRAALTGLEFLSGIPGTIGGALRMNAGAFGREMKDITLTAKAVDETGALHQLSAGDLSFSYRSCGVPRSWMFISATMEGTSGDVAEINKRMADIQIARNEDQPRGTFTGGSTFVNPSGHKAWELIDAAGCRGLKNGGAMVSEKHCNFLINVGDASAADIEELGEEVRGRVRASSGIELKWEIRRVGVPVNGGVHS
jgi:UDP-N-acetylmuramate dehydrogenase